MTRAADPTSVLCKRYSMYEPGKRVARGWNARWRRRTSGESRDTVQRRYKERRRGRVEGTGEGEDRGGRGRGGREKKREKRTEKKRSRCRLGLKCVNALPARDIRTVPARSFVRHRAERSGAEPSGAVCSSPAAGNAQTHASLPRDQTANTVGLPLHCDNSLIARKDTRRVEHDSQPSLLSTNPVPSSFREKERERSVPIWKREAW